MTSFLDRFVQLCDDEPVLWHPDDSGGGGLGAATERIAAALDWPGFLADKVKPLYDQFSAYYEEDVRTYGVGSNWSNRYKAMDAYLGTFVRGETSECPSDVRGVEESSNNVKIDEEDVPCDICRSPIPENGNEMIFCDSCNVCVHQACYGVKRIPEGDWFCRPCEANVEPPCILCPTKRGAMKYTSDGQNWAHVSCALWIKEVKIGNPDLVEPIIISRIPASRCNLVCSLCRRKTGACIQCVVNHCKIAFHVTCAFDKGLKMEYKDIDENGLKLLSYCTTHSKTEVNQKYKKETLKKKGERSRKSITTPQGVHPHLQRKSSSEAVALVDSDSESEDTDSSFDDSDQSFESNLLLDTDSESDVSDKSSESDSSYSSQNSVSARTQIKREEPDESLTPTLRLISKNEQQLPREEENPQTRTRLKSIRRKMSGETFSNKKISVENVVERINGSFRNKHSNAKTKTTLDNRIFSDEQTAFKMKEQLPSDNYSPEILYEHSFNDGRTYSNFKQENGDKQLSKEQTIAQTRTGTEPIRRKISGETFSSNITSVENVAEEINDVFRNKHSDAKTLEYRSLLDEQTPFKVKEEQIPSDTSSPEILYEHSINDGHARSTFKQEEEQFSKDEEITRLEPIRREISGTTYSSNITSFNVSQNIKGIFRNKHPYAETLYNRIISDEQTAFRMQEQIPSKDSSPEILYDRFINGGHTYSTPITHKTNFVQEAPQCKNELPTSTKETWRKKIGNLISSTENGYFSASEINHQASCSYDIPSTSQQKPQESFVTQPHAAMDELVSRDRHATSTEEEYQDLVASINRTKSLLRRLTEDKQHYRKKRTRTDSMATASSEGSSGASSSDKKETKRIRMGSIQKNIAERPSSERNEHYQQFAKVISTVLISIPPQIAATLEDKIITMCLKSHRQWKQIESKNR